MHQRLTASSNSGFDLLRLRTPHGLLGLLNTAYDAVREETPSFITETLARTVAALLTKPTMPAPARVTVDEFERAARQETKRAQDATSSSVLSLQQLRLWHARRGTLHLFYIQYPSNAPR